MNKFRIVSAALLGLSLFLLAENIYSQSTSPNNLLELLDFSAMDSYLDTSDRQTTQQQWLDYARFGMNEALADWEKEALLIMGEDFDLSLLRKEAETSLNDVIETRLIQWLDDRFFNSIDHVSLGELSREIENLNELYLYEFQDDGSIRYKTSLGYADLYTTDGFGDPVLAEKGEKTLWAEGVKSKITELTDLWSQTMVTAFADLKASITDQELLIRFEREWTSDMESYREKYIGRLFRLYSMEQSRFTRLRLFDQYSLQHLSETETAGYISNELISRTQAELNTGLNALAEGLETRVGEVRTDGGIIDADAWQESFSSLLEQGMDSWDAAEEELLMERVQWEQTASTEKNGGEQAWAEALSELRVKRSEWMADYRLTLEEGTRLWAEESAALEEALTKAITELDESIGNSSLSLQSRIDNIVGMLLQSVNMMRTARTSWEYWMDKVDQGEKGSFETGSIEFDEESMRAVMEKYKSSGAAREEAEYWLELFAVYGGYAEDSQLNLAETYGIVVFDNPSLTTAFEDGQLSGALFDQSLLDDPRAWENFYLDNFQVELLKAKAYMQYWEKQEEIARAVYDYASDETSTKEDAEETEQKLEAAKTGYETVLSEYTGLLERLSDISGDLQLLQEDMQTIQLEIDGYQQELSDAKDEYNQIINDLYVDNPAYLSEQYREYYIQLLESYGMHPDSEDSLASVFEEYLLAAKAYGLEDQISLVSERVVELLSGGDDNNFDSGMFNPATASLSELHERMMITSAAGFTSADEPGDTGLFSIADGNRVNEFSGYLESSLMLQPGDYYYNRLIELFAIYHDEDCSSPSEILWEMQIAVTGLQEVCLIDYELRLAELRLFTADDFSSWGELYFGTASYDEIITFSQPAGLEVLDLAIEYDIDVYSEIFSLYDEHGPDGFSLYDWDVPVDSPEDLNELQAYQKLWDSLRGDDLTNEEAAAEISEMLTSLSLLKSWLSDLGPLKENIPALEKALLSPDEALGHDLLAAYLNGSHNLGSDIGDLYSYIYADELFAQTLEYSIAEMLRLTGGEAPVLAQLQYEVKRDGLLGDLESEGLFNSEDMSFYSPEAVMEMKSFDSADEVVLWFSKLDRLGGQSYPLYLTEMLDAYIDELKTYTAMSTAEKFPDDIPLDLGELNEKIRAQSGMISELSLLGQRLLTDGDDDLIKLLRIALSENMDAALSASAEARMIETAGFDLAIDAAGSASFTADSTAWNELYNDYMQNPETAYSLEDGFELYKDSMLERAAELYELASALIEPDSIDWSAESAENLEIYRAMLWNTLGFDDAFSMITGSDAAINIPELINLRLIDQLMPDFADDFPGDVRLDWLYGGNETLQAVDVLITGGVPLLWAAPDFSPGRETSIRYYSEAELQTFSASLELTADEINAGLIPADKAMRLWNDEFRTFAAADSLEGSLRAAAGLILIDQFMTLSGGYGGNYLYDDLLVDLLAGLTPGEDDAALFHGIATDPDAALAARLDCAAELPADGLGGEDLYWNLMWKAGVQALSDEWDTALCRDSLIFRGALAEAEILSSWIDSREGEGFQEYSDALEAGLDRNVDLLMSLAAMDEGEIYSDIAAAGIAALLTEQAGWTSDEAAGFINWFLDAKGVEYSYLSSELDELLSVPEEQRLWKIFEDRGDAAVHYLKNGIFSGRYSLDETEQLLSDTDFMTEEEKTEILAFKNQIDAISVYKPLLHGDFESYLDGLYDNDADKSVLRSALSRYYGSREIQWDDPVFSVSLMIPNLSSGLILENLSYNRTRALNSYELNPVSAMSVNGVFINNIASVISSRLYEDEESEVTGLALLQNERDLASRAGDYHQAVLPPDKYSDNWRSFLIEDYLNSGDDDLNLLPESYSSGEDYGRDLTIGGEDAPVLEIFNGLVIFTGSGDDKGNMFRDAENETLDKAAFLAAAFEVWTADDAGVELTAELQELQDSLSGEPLFSFWQELESSDYGDLCDSYLYDHNASIVSAYNDASYDYYRLDARIVSLKAGMSELGRRREQLEMMSGLGDEELITEMKPLTDRIKELEQAIDAAQGDWQNLIDGSNGREGYREFEEAYADVYELTRMAADEIDVKKHEYAIARSIHQFASAGYLSLDEETLAIFDPADDEVGIEVDEIEPEGEVEEDAGVVGGTKVAADVEVDGLTPEQLYRDALIETINRVSPSERLSYVVNKLNRAAAAYDALRSIMGSEPEDFSAYSGDEVYRTYFDAYIETFRESLVMNKINYVLNKAIASQEAITAEALSDWDEIMHDSYGNISYLDEDGNVRIPDALESLHLELTGDSWSIDWGPDQSESKDAVIAAEAYFSPNEDSETGHSAYEEDLTRWLENVSAMINDGRTENFTIWAMALKWEDYQALDKDNEEDVAAFWRAYLDRNGEEDLDKEGAKSRLISSWTDAHNEVNALSDDGRWMFNFYKLIEKSGSMQIDSAADTFALLAEQESLVIANQYMAEEQREGAEELIIAAIPMFAMAAAYYALAWAVMAVPFGWIAGLVLLTAAVGLSLHAGNVQGEGFAKRAAANDIETKVVAPGKENIRLFESNFKLVTSGILEKKSIYDTEYSKLQTMRGEEGGDENLSDAQRITGLQSSVIGAFEREGEDLHGLLIQAGLVNPDGNAAADKAALAVLFGYYQGRMSESAKDDSTSSSKFISALEKEAQEYKQITARELNDYLTGADGAAQKQNDVEAEYETAYYDYIREKITLEEFKAAAQTAWSDPQFSIREHLLRLYEEQNAIAGMIMGTDQFNSEISRDLLESQKLLLSGDDSSRGIYDYRMENYREVRLYEMDVLRLEMNEKRSHWEAQMNAITARGELEWSAGERKLNRSYKQWYDETSRAYLKQTESWEDKYLDFLGDKQTWLDAVTVQSTDYGNNEVLENFGEMTAAAVAAAGADVLVGDFVVIKEEPDEIVSGLIDFDLLENLLENASSLNASIGDTKTVIFTASAPDSFTTADSLQAIKDFQALQNEEYEKHLARLEFERLLEQAEYAEEQFTETVEEANRSMSGNIHATMRDDGYTLRGDVYKRNLVVGSTYSEYLYNDAYVSKYEYYTPGDGVDTDFSKDLEAAETGLDMLDADSLSGLVAKAQDKIEEALKLIFGDEEDLDSYLYEDIGLSGSENEDGSFHFTRTENAAAVETPNVIENLVMSFVNLFDLAGEEELTDEQKKAAAEDAKKKFAQLSPGYFGMHVGYAPVFFDNADTEKAWDAAGQIRYDGYGEMGRVMGEFLFNKIKESGGWAEVNMPHYKKKLWDDRGSWIKAPSIADLSSMAVSVVTMGALGTGQALLSAGMNLADDIALNIADAAVGEKTWDEGLVNFGKTALSSLLTAGLNPGVDVSNMGLGEMLVTNFSQEFSNNLISSGVNSITYDTEKGFGYNLDALNEGLFGTGAIAGYVGSAVGTVAGSGLDSLTRGSWTPVEQAFYGSALTLGEVAAQQGSQFAVHTGFQLAKDGFNNVGGSLTTAFDNMRMSFNILDIGSLMDMTRLMGSTMTGNYEDSFMSGWDTASENLTGTGLFALNINSSGITGAITTGGVNIGSSIYNLGKGFTMDMATRAYAAENEGIGVELIRKGYAHGDQSFEDTIWRVLAGKDSLHFDFEGEAEAITIGKTNDGRAIHLGSEFANASDAEMLKAAAILQHEAHRDGQIGLQNDSETYRAVKSHTEIALGLTMAYGIDFIAGDENLMGDVVEYMMARGDGKSAFNEDKFNDYVAGNYDSTQDYWKLMDDGEIVWDGERDLKNEHDDLLRKDSTGSFSQSLMKYLGKEDTLLMLEDRGIETEGKTDAELAYSLMTSSGAYWSDANDQYNVIPVHGYKGTDLESRLKFDLTDEDAVNLGKISQQSPTVAYEYGEGSDKINATEVGACVLFATYGAVQTHAGTNFSAEQLNRMTSTGLFMNYLEVDNNGIGTLGESGREMLSAVAFAELGLFKQLDFNRKGTDGSIIVGNTENGNVHAREADSSGNELFDPYSPVTYKEGESIFDTKPYDVINYKTQFLYSYLYYTQYEDYYRSIEWKKYFY